MNINDSEKYARSAGYVNITNKNGECHHSINPDCPVCHKPVFWSRHIISAGRAWHVQCFKCSFCNKILNLGEQSFHGTKLLCTKPCYNELFVGHSLPPTKQHLPKAEEGEHNCQWGSRGNRETCMRCLSCERVMIPGEYAAHDRFPFCKFAGYGTAKEEHTKQNFKKYPCVNSLCVRCLKPVFAAEFCYSISYPWHIHCLRCASCDRNLQPGAHAVHEGLPFCAFPCYNRIFAVNGFRRSINECRP